MHKESREKAWKATSKARTKPINKNISTDADIVNLNKDNEFIPFEEDIEIEEKIPLTEEEKKEVRKKLFILLIAIVITLIIMIIMLIFDPFGSSDKKDDKETDKPIVEENKNDEDKDKNKTLKDVKDGKVSLQHADVVKLVELIEFNSNEYKYNDTPSLYSTSPILISKISNKNKLFLTSKSDTFKELFKTKIANDDVCASELNIPTTEMNKIVKKVLNTEVSEYVSFYYSYYEGNSYVKDILFTKQNDLYIGKCLTDQPTPKSIVQQQFLGATKEKNKLYIDVKIVFANQSGVYKDPNFKTLITNDKNLELDKYISEGNTYRHTFDISSDNYYLENISLLK